MIPDLPRDVVALVNGGPPSTSMMVSRGLHYGDGVFRTLLRWEGRWLDFDRHYVKLVQDCRALDLDPPHFGQLQAELDALGGGRATPQVGKLMLCRAGAGRGYAPQGRAVDRILLRYPAPKFPHSYYEQGVAVAESPVALGIQPLLAGVKHLNRLENVLAARHWPAHVQEVLMSSSAGFLICGSKSNLFWIQGEQLFTPRLHQCGVAGVMRGKIIDLARGLGARVQQVEATVASLLSADAVFLCNSLIGLWPVKQLGDRPLPPLGGLGSKLRDALEHPLLTESSAEGAAPQAQHRLLI